MESPKHDHSNQLSGNNRSSSRIQSIKFVNNEHLCNAFNFIQAMRSKQQLCDIILEVDGHTMRAHKLVLAATSPYFHAMFNGK